MENQVSKSDAPIEKSEQKINRSSNAVPLIIGIAFLVILIALSIFRPEWTANNYLLFKAMLSIALALIAILLPGFININLPNGIKASGGMAIFILVLLLTPDISPKAFNLNVNVHGPEEGIHDNILKNEGKIILSKVGESNKLPAYINENGTAIFQQLPPEYWKSEIVFGIESDFYKLTDPKEIYKIQSNGIDLEITPKLISRIHGRVEADQVGGVSGAEILLVGDTTFKITTDVSGSFSFSIPAEHQKAEFRVIASKEGYRFSASIPKYEEAINAPEAENPIYIPLQVTPIAIDAVPPPPPPAAQIEESNVDMVKFRFKYKNQFNEINFPANLNVQALIYHLCNKYATDYNAQIMRCSILQYGVVYGWDKPIEALNTQLNNNEIQLQCNQDAIPNLRTNFIEISGLATSNNLLVLIDGSPANSIMVQNNIIKATTGYGNWGNGRKIDIFDLESKKKTTLKSVKYSSEITGTLVITVTPNNSIRVIDRPKQ
jgi:hypothetical protein